MGGVAEGCKCAADDDESKLICPHCRIVPPTDDYMFCYNCGQRLWNREDMKNHGHREGEEGWKVGGATLPDYYEPSVSIKRMPEDRDRDQLQQFLEAQELGHLAQKMKDKVGIIKLADLLHASDADVDNICDVLRLKMGEKLRVKAAIKTYKTQIEAERTSEPAPMYSSETVQMMDHLFETLEQAGAEAEDDGLKMEIASSLDGIRKSLKKVDPEIEGITDCSDWGDDDFTLEDTFDDHEPQSVSKRQVPGVAKR